MVLKRFAAETIDLLPRRLGLKQGVVDHLGNGCAIVVRHVVANHRVWVTVGLLTWPLGRHFATAES